MAGFAVDGRDFVGMRVGLDVGVAVGALQAAVNAGAEPLAVDGDTVAVAVGCGGVTMAGKTISRGLGAKDGGREGEGENGDGGCEDSVAKARWSVIPCGEIHPAVFFPQAKAD